MSLVHLLKLKLGTIDSRIEAARWLGDLKDKRAVPSLIKALSDRRNWIREAAAAALGEIGDTRAVEPLIAVFSDGYSTDSVCAAASKALGKLGDIKAIETLTAALNSKDSSVKWEAAKALGKFKDTRAVEPLLASLKSSSISYSSIVDALGEIRDTRAVEPLIAELRKDFNIWTSSVVKALGNIGDTRAIEPLLSGLKHEDEFVRIAAAEALGKIGDKRACASLRKALEDTDDRVKKAAAKAIKEIGNECAGAALPIVSTLFLETTEPEENDEQHNSTKRNLPHILLNLYLHAAFFIAYTVFSIGLILWIYTQFDLAKNNASATGVITEFIRDDVVEEYEGRRSAVVWEMRYEYVVNGKTYFGLRDFKEGTEVGEKVNVIYNLNNPSQHFVGDGGAVGRAVIALIVFLIATYIVGKELISSSLSSWHEWCMWQQQYTWNNTGWHFLVFAGGVFFSVVGFSVGSVFAEFVSSINWLAGYRRILILCGVAACFMLYIMRIIYEGMERPITRTE